MNKTGIEWCDYTWNPITGCSRVSDGCANCYAEAISKRFHMPWGRAYFHPERLSQPASVKKPSRVFVCSMSDIGHESVKREWLYYIYDAMRSAPQHQYILLTKRPNNLEYALIPKYSWVGVTVENQAAAWKWAWLSARWNGLGFVSVEPMLGPVSFDKFPNKPDWVIAGPETGSKARPFVHRWIENLSLESECFFDKRHDYLRREFP